MAQQPFNPEGVQAKQDELYALPDDQLLSHANEIRNNFRNWVKANFLLDTEQQAFLDSIDNRWIQLSSCQTGTAIENRLPIILESPVAKSGFKVMASKLIGETNDMKITFSNGIFKAEGGLRFYINYQ